MKVIDCYYRFERLDNSKSKSRFDLVYYSEIYEPLDHFNKEGKFWIYLAKGEYLRTHSKRKPDLAISTRLGHYLTGVYIPELDKPNLAFGDYLQDALLFVIAEGMIEILICKGKKNIVHNLFNLLFDEELTQELEKFREQVKKPIQTTQDILYK